MTDIIDAADTIEGTRLPPDLVRVILEWLFDMHRAHRKTSQLELLIISKQVKSWLEPLLFRHISIPSEVSPEYTAQISRALREPQLAASIRAIRVSFLSPPSISLLLDILQTNESINRLVVWDWVGLGGNTDKSVRIWQTKVPSLRRLSILVVHQGTEILAPEFPIFQSLTHLYIGLLAHPGSPIIPLNSMLHPIRALDNLSHLAIEFSCPHDAAHNIIRSHLPSSTKTVILNLKDRSHGSVSIDWLLKACDPRLVFVLVDDSDNEKRASGLFLDHRQIGDTEWDEDPPLPDMWESADLALERRREMQADVERQGGIP